MDFLQFYNDCRQRGEIGSTDKNDWGHTYITNYYNEKFTPLRNEPIKILEIGNYRGDGLRLFRQWFTKASIYGIEYNPIIYDEEKKDYVYIRSEPKYGKLFNNGISEEYIPGCWCYMLNAYDSYTLNNFDNETFDIIIEDGSHTLQDQLYVLKHWLKKIKPGGTLIIEDIQDIAHCEEFKKVLDDTVTATVHDFRIPNQTTPDNIIFEVVKNPTSMFDQFFEYKTSTDTVIMSPSNHPDTNTSTSLNQKKKILVAQYYTQNLADRYAKFSEELNRKYCALHGYDYVVENDDISLRTVARDEEIALQWYKVPFLSKLLDTYKDHEWILFLDADAIFSNMSQQIESFCDDAYDLIISTNEVHHCITNTGVILVKNTEWSREFLKKWWDSRNTTTGKDVNDILDWNGGMHAPDNGSVFKSALWHEQTCISLLYKLDPTIEPHIKFIDEKIFNSHLYNPNAFIFHAFAYGFEPNRSLDTIHEALTSEFQRMNKITVVYFVYCVHDYLTRVKNDLQRMIQSGLYNDLFDLHVVASIPDRNSSVEETALNETFSGYDKVILHKVYDNKFEHYGVVRAWLEAHKSDGPILYFHAKGVTAIYTETNSHTEWKQRGDESFIEMLKYFMIDNYKQCLAKLKVYDQVNVSDSYSRGWPSGNFWWANKIYLRENPFPWESTYDRWASEAWINFRRKHYTMFQCYERFGFRDKFTYLPELSYKAPYKLMDSKITMLSAKLVTLMEPENEYDRNRPSDANEVDVSEFIHKNLEKNQYKGFTDIIVTLNTLGDPIPDKEPAYRKCLIIEFTITGDDTVYRIAVDEGQAFSYRIDRYNAVGYMFHRNTKTILENISVIRTDDIMRFAP